MEDKFSVFLPTQENSKWTLKQDAQLRECLEEFTTKLLSTMSHLENTEKKLEVESERLVLRLENIHNNIAALRMTKFVDERIIDVPSEVLKKTEISHLQKQQTNKSEQEQRTTNTIKIAVKQGLQLITDHFQEVNLADADFFANVDPSFVPEPIFQAKPKYGDRKLPAIIGTQEFAASPTAGLFDDSPITSPPTTNVTIKLPQNQQPARSVEPIVGPAHPAEFKPNPTVHAPEAVHQKVAEPVNVPVAPTKEVEPELQDLSPLPVQTTKVVVPAPTNPSETTTSATLDQRILLKAPTPSPPVRTHTIQLPVSSKEPEQRAVKETSSQPPKAVASAPQPAVRVTKKQGLLFSSSSDSEQDDMSKPVMKSFDANFSDRLAAAIKQGPVAMRSTREADAVSRRPVSMSSVPEKKGDTSLDKGNSLRASVPRTTNSSVSDNEELGPSSVASRISQIGDRIPIGGRTSAANKKPLEDKSSNENGAKPPISNESVKDRPKGPARRAPSNLRKPAESTEDTAQVYIGATPPLNVQAEQQQQKPPPPKVSPKAGNQSVIAQPTNLYKTSASLPKSGAVNAPNKQITAEKAKIKSIFDSSSSGDDDLALPKTMTAPNTKVPTTGRNVQAVSKPPLFGSNLPTTKKVAGSQPKKSLFEDSGSEEE